MNPHLLMGIVLGLLALSFIVGYRAGYEDGKNENPTRLA